MDHRIRFTVSLDDMVDTQRLIYRQHYLAPASVFVLLGLAFAAAGIQVGIGMAVLGLLMFVLWRFPTVDRWLIQRNSRDRLGAICEVWIDAAGISYRQAGLTGHIEWSAITRVIENERTLLLLRGGALIVAVPKRAFASREAEGQFVHAVRAGIETRSAD